MPFGTFIGQGWVTDPETPMQGAGCAVPTPDRRAGRIVPRARRDDPEHRPQYLAAARVHRRTATRTIIQVEGT